MRIIAIFLSFWHNYCSLPQCYAFQMTSFMNKPLQTDRYTLIEQSGVTLIEQLNKLLCMRLTY